MKKQFLSTLSTYNLRNWGASFDGLRMIGRGAGMSELKKYLFKPLSNIMDSQGERVFYLCDFFLPVRTE